VGFTLFVFDEKHAFAQISLFRNIGSGTLSAMRSVTGDFCFYKLAPTANMNVWLNKTVWVFKLVLFNNFPKI
jgi:hypothetical protein